MKKGNYWIGVYCGVLLLTLLFAQWGSHAVTAMVEGSPIHRSHTVIIDAGHGGIDGGATSCTGVLEKTLNLQISLRLEDLMHLLGLNTRMIRTTDTSVYTQGDTIARQKVSDLKQRLKITEETPGAILLSIHQNTFSDSRYSGPQVFYGDSAQSESLAKVLQEALSQSLAPESRRQSKPGKGIWLLEKVNCPGVLIECGFLSNPGEEARLRSPDYQKKICAVIACILNRELSNT